MTIAALYKKVNNLNNITRSKTLNEAARGGGGGKSFVILGQYDTLAQLIAEHPKGSPGDTYLVGQNGNTSMYIWVNNTWAQFAMDSISSDELNSIISIFSE